MANYNFNVDTRPMANQIDRVSDNVNGVKTAVVTMQTAVIAAETKASSILCNKVNTGFYKLMLSQIVQKGAIAESEAKAFLLELSHQEKDLGKLKTRMENDFQKIIANYTTTCNELNNALHMRISELDKPTMDFVSKDIHLCENRINGLIAKVPVNQSESLSVSQAIAASHIKHNAAILIDCMKRYLKFFNFQRQHTEQIMQNEVIDRPEKLYIPVIVVQNKHENGSTQETFISNSRDIRLKSIMESSIVKSVSDKMDGLHWIEVDDSTFRKVTGEFNRYVAVSEASQRVMDTINKLYQQNKWQIAKEV